MIVLRRKEFGLKDVIDSYKSGAGRVENTMKLAIEMHKRTGLPTEKCLEQINKQNRTSIVSSATKATSKQQAEELAKIDREVGEQSGFPKEKIDAVCRNTESQHE